MKTKSIKSLKWVYQSNDISWVELSHLYKIAPLGVKSPEHLQMVFSRSRFSCFIYDEETLIGAGRVLSDGADCSYICDIVIHPDYQENGLGREMLEKLVTFSKGHQKIILYAVPGKETFYKKSGFSRMLTAMAIFKDQSKAVDMKLIEKD